MKNSAIAAPGLRRVRDVLARHVESGRIPGLVALVGRGGETHIEAIGTMRHDGGAPMRHDTIFRMASTSKPVAVAPVLMLIDECRLRLDDPVEPWLPELAGRRVLKRVDGPLDDTVPARRPITVRSLLTSTFGLGMDLTSPEAPVQVAIQELELTGRGAPPPEPDEWMRRLGTLPLTHQPGAHWQYHISNDVLGVLVARVTGRPFATFLRERLFEPLGMKDTGFHVPADGIDRLPPAYVPDPRTGEFIVWDEAAGGRYSRPPEFPSGGGGLVSTVADYHAYFRMLLNHGMHGSERILSRPAVQLMTTNRLTPAQQAPRDALADSTPLAYGLGKHGGWGFGMATRTYRSDFASVGQFGWDGGTGTTAYADPEERLTGMLLTQVGMSTPDSPRAIHDFWTTVYQAIDE
ncbi:serine hydrolase domain-containing protein [Streptomyces yaizuensis]|uniref:Serine hydrolase n=1 Tax=Streptomyces yaizuensis TaxID=2989713 RepID=A0ABQ5PAC6_9ACTN|nr:serine hydrolase domain-containing protein [Streptomyces sp. YSPA8]GLF99537.1 serine hydrolase [Streptomyces sp. YSPA8]